MIKEMFVILKWHPKTKLYYINKGYVFTKFKEEFEVKINDLQINSNIKITPICDICKKENVKMIKYNDYNKCIRNGGFYCCIPCSRIKINKTNLDKYGTEWVMQSQINKEKSKQTCINKYGVDNISKTLLFKEKYKNTMNNKYGVDNGFQINFVKEKSRKTCLKKYGSEYYNQSYIGKLKISGVNSKFYIDGRCKINYNRSTDVDEKLWRNRVYKRDNYTCQYCNDNKGGNLNSHHLDGWNWCIDKRYDIDNGVTLCKKCHEEFHHIYGYGDNTKEQFEEFMLNFEPQTTIENK